MTSFAPITCNATDAIHENRGVGSPPPPPHQALAGLYGTVPNKLIAQQIQGVTRFTESVAVCTRIYLNLLTQFNL